MATGKSFLVVDDDLAELEIMCGTLSDAFPHVTIHQLNHPDRAVQTCRDREFDCVILDYNMPGVEDLELAAELRELFPYLPIVLVTSFGDEMLAARAFKVGVSDYIAKARVNAESIRRVVRRAIHDAGQARMIQQQAEELEHFAYALAHDFKQPIRQMKTFANLLRTDLDHPSADRETVRKHLDFLHGAAERLGDLVDVMSQYTLLHQPPVISDINLNMLTDGLLASLATFITDRKAQVTIRDLPIARGNGPMMQQALQNLIINGLRYNKSVAPRVTVSGETFDTYCVITIEDNGIGIAEEYQDTIFKPLTRLHNASEYPGSGLGLTLTRKAVLSQGGRIWLESTPDEGTRFYIRLPTPLAQTQVAAAR